MATHSSILAWRIRWTGKPGRLYSPWGHRVGHDLATTHTRWPVPRSVFKDEVLKKSHRLKETKEAL